MLKLKKVAITGGIGSGKTTVCLLFKELGAYVVSADKIVHQLLTPKTDLGKSVISLLGKEIVEGEELNREEIAKRVFRDFSLLKQLEERIHPEVQKEIKVLYQKVSKQSYSLFIAEVPLLFEAGQESYYDAIIVVDADEERCKRQFVENTQYDEEEFQRRVQRLLPIQEKKQRADFFIENNGTLEDLHNSVKFIFKSLQGRL